jgi:FtsP/CotA-like multicopper oxidase with cupredoxin domain
MIRRDFIKAAGLASAGLVLLPTGFRRLNAAAAIPGLSDPAAQPMFENLVPDALAQSFIYKPDRKGRYKIKIGTAIQNTGLVGLGGLPVSTPVWGYGDQKDNVITWPGRTFQIQSGLAGGAPKTEVFWANSLKGVNQHLLPVDTSAHWCYSLPGYTKKTIAKNGVPIITHLHGGHSDFQFDGNPEFFYNPDGKVIGPQWDYVPGGFTTKFRYDNNVPAGNLWYHDHALGITRLNVYAGMAGFYFVRDDDDTGTASNPLGLPAQPYEKAYAIQDRMFMETGELFYPSMPGDPFWADFIDDGMGGGAVVENGGDPDLVPRPSALAEFFGDHMVVNGMIWPFEVVEPRNYRLHLLNGTDSRFMAIQFFEVPQGAKNFDTVLSGPIDFTVIGSDQGLASSPTTLNTLVSEPGSRYDIIVDFKNVTFGNRVIMKNIGGDEPFGGDLPGVQVFGETDRIMAFDVETPRNETIADVSPTGINFGPSVPTLSDCMRKVALFEGQDEYSRLQPLLGTAEPSTDYLGAPINWPNTPEYSSVGLIGQMEGSIAWHSPTTENPALGDTEEWEIWNMTGDAHPVHLHLVHFEILGRQEIVMDSAADDDGFIPAGSTPADNGAYLVNQPTVQHNSVAGDLTTYGKGFRIVHPTNPDDVYGDSVNQPDGYVENTPKDMVIALPGQVTRIRATFDKPGRYVWHCHILSHEDHEMMRVLHVGPGADAAMHKSIGEKAASATPATFALAQNYPNPFNPSTTINFQLPKDEFVELKIYNRIGQEVRTLVNSGYQEGSHNVVWDGKNNRGKSVASGMYLYRIKAGNYTKSMKMNLVR